MPDAVVAGALAGIAAISLPLGAVVAIFFRPPARVVAIVMAFGSGALIHAVVTELAVHPASSLVLAHHFLPGQSWLVVAGGFLAGGLLYVALNRVVEGMGGGFHWRHRLRRKALDDKRARAMPILQALSRSRIATCLSPEEAEEILPFVRSVRVTGGQAVFRRGDPSDGLYIVASGTFEIHHNGHVHDGGDIHAGDSQHLEQVTFIETGAVVGGIGMLGGQPRIATLVAREDGELLMLARADFDHLTERVPCLRKIVADIVTRQLFVSARDGVTLDPDEWQRIAVGSIEHLTRAEVEAASEQSHKESSPLAIFVGTLQDGIPESLAIGAGFAGLAAFSPTFMVAVFLSNLPEAVAGTSALLKARFSVLRVMLMWSGLLIGSALAGTVGYVLLHEASSVAIAFLQALAGGGVVAMLAMTMMPEAYESGRSGVAPATIVGFLASLLLAVFELGASGGAAAVGGH
jgi:CRP-like cAMP-binding protein